MDGQKIPSCVTFGSPFFRHEFCKRFVAVCNYWFSFFELLRAQHAFPLSLPSLKCNEQNPHNLLFILHLSVGGGGGKGKEGGQGLSLIGHPLSPDQFPSPFLSLCLPAEGREEGERKKCFVFP